LDFISSEEILMELELILVGVLNVWLRITECRLLRRVNGEGKSALASTNSKRPIGSYNSIDC
jgi:hypothetical protein